MYIKSQVGSGHALQKIHGDDVFVRQDIIGADETCSDVAFQDIWGSGNTLAENRDGCPLVQITENMSGVSPHENGSRTVVVAYFLNKYACLQAIVCDTVVYILSDEGKTIDIHRACSHPQS